MGAIKREREKGRERAHICGPKATGWVRGVGVVEVVESVEKDVDNRRQETKS
jgi:hypothetical protein